MADKDWQTEMERRAKAHEERMNAIIHECKKDIMAWMDSKILNHLSNQDLDRLWIDLGGEG